MMSDDKPLYIKLSTPIDPTQKWTDYLQDIYFEDKEGICKIICGGCIIIEENIKNLSLEIINNQFYRILRLANEPMYIRALMYHKISIDAYPKQNIMFRVILKNNNFDNFKYYRLYNKNFLMYSNGMGTLRYMY